MLIFEPPTGLGDIVNLRPEYTTELSGAFDVCGPHTGNELLALQGIDGKPHLNDPEGLLGDVNYDTMEAGVEALLRYTAGVQPVDQNPNPSPDDGPGVIGKDIFVH